MNGFAVNPVLSLLAFYGVVGAASENFMMNFKSFLAIMLISRVIIYLALC